MGLEEFARLVREMRRCQKDYFRSKSSRALEESKKAERAVDAALDALAEGPGLFDPPPASEP